MNVKISLDEHASMPSYGTDGSAGLDLTATEVTVEYEKSICTYRTGVRLQIPEGYVGLLFPRSSVSKTPSMLKNSVGIIDSDYRGEIMVKFHLFDSKIPYNLGERIAQLIILPFPKIEFSLVDDVSQLGNTQRGDGGFGSTGK